jgi:hypothetical protein
VRPHQERKRKEEEEEEEQGLWRLALLDPPHPKKSLFFHYET